MKGGSLREVGMILRSARNLLPIPFDSRPAPPKRVFERVPSPHRSGEAVDRKTRTDTAQPQTKTNQRTVSGSNGLNICSRLPIPTPGVLRHLSPGWSDGRRDGRPSVPLSPDGPAATDLVRSRVSKSLPDSLGNEIRDAGRFVGRGARGLALGTGGPRTARSGRTWGGAVCQRRHLVSPTACALDTCLNDSIFV